MSSSQQQIKRALGPRRVDTDPRFTRRRASVARQRRRKLLISAAILVGLAATIWALFFSPLLMVRDVKVTGIRFTEDADIAAAADVAGTGQNLLLLPVDDVRARVERLPWVAEAQVDRMLPGTVRIKVVEHRPAMVLSLGAARWTIDRFGQVLATGVAQEGLPVLAGVEIGSIEPGLKLMTEESTAALKVLRSLPGSLREQVVGIFAPTSERITLSLVSGTTVRYGSAERVGDKNEVLKVLLARLESEPTMPAYIDVRVPTSPAVSPAAAEDPEPTATPSP